MSKMLRRIRSPREAREKEGKEHPAPNRSFSAGHLLFSHRRHKSDEIQNVIYSEPNVLTNSHGGPHNVMSQQLEDNPPLPPRNRPASVGHPHPLKSQNSTDEDPYYVAPVDTLRKGIVNPAILSQGAEKVPGPTRSERKQMQLHEMTLSQKHVLGHRRTGSFGHVIDNSDYTVPWNLLQKEKQKAAAKHEGDTGTSVKPPPKPQRSSDRSKRVIPSMYDDGHDNIIDLSPSPPQLTQDVRSHSNSPSSPTQIGTTAEATSSHSEKEDDYDEPWDKKYHVAMRLAEKARRQSGGQWKSESEMEHMPGAVQRQSPKMPEKSPHGHHHHQEPHSYHHHHHGDRTSPQPDLRPRINTRSSDRGSPPAGDGRPKSGSIRTTSASHQLSPQPELRSRGDTKSSSEKTPRGSPWGDPPKPSESHSLGSAQMKLVSQHGAPADYLPPSTSPETPLRTNSTSYKVPVSQRRLPSPPLEAGGDPSDSKRWSRTNSPPTAYIDLSIPLESQL